MAIYIAIFCCLMVLFSRKTEKTFLNPVTFFNAMWGLIVFLSHLQLFKLRATSNSTYFIIFIGILSFTIGYYSLRYINFKVIFSSIDKKYSIDYSIRYTLLIVIAFFILFLQLPYVIESLKTLISGQGLGTIRKMAQNGEGLLGTVSAYRNVINIFFVTPFSMVLLVLAGIDFWIGKRNKLFILLSVSIPVISLVINGGRSSFINFIISFILSFIFSNGEKVAEFSKLLIKRRYLIFSFFLILAIIVVILATLSRNGEESSTALLYYYFAMEPLMLETWLGYINLDQLGYGMASLNGFIFPMMFLVVNFLGIQYPRYWKNIYDLTMLTDSRWINIAGGRSANAYVSIFWFLYLDGGLFGVIIGMFIYGMLLGIAFKSSFLVFETNIKKQSIYIIMFIGLVYSFARIQFTLSSYTLAVLYLIFFSFKKKLIFKGGEHA
ncbi:TPA: O-antigen polymerase [Streptococcus suis]